MRCPRTGVVTPDEPVEHLLPHTSGGLVAEICCTIVEKPEQLVSQTYKRLHGLSLALEVAAIVRLR